MISCGYCAAHPSWQSASISSADPLVSYLLEMSIRRLRDYVLHSFCCLLHCSIALYCNKSYNNARTKLSRTKARVAELLPDLLQVPVLRPAAGLEAGHQLQQRGGVAAVARHLVAQLPVLLLQPGQHLLPLPGEWGQLSLDITWQHHQNFPIFTCCPAPAWRGISSRTRYPCSRSWWSSCGDGHWTGPSLGLYFRG